MGHVVDGGNGARFLVVVLALAVPADLAWRASARRRHSCAGLPLCLLLLLSPAFSMQYLVWGLAPALLFVELRVAAVYVAVASAFVLVVYSGWNRAEPWNWDEAVAIPLPGSCCR